jgi:hypothetical protein
VPVYIPSLPLDESTNAVTGVPINTLIRGLQAIKDEGDKLAAAKAFTILFGFMKAPW